ncbi:hypothetical protein FXN63_08320 [Pigmentiphaga aceris]|uniref:DUF2917 domain-containing protein n=1 Tax=Pigmentiphaga aceris TaxID=1940612 RepID=A0A5C0AW51_9BURK|nr:hypothetical protein [Pigmentiphaga aceris]QEI05854.1 hypothetical protein FXN63_08320 [Pigmentiphaga aceris]
MTYPTVTYPITDEDTHSSLLDIERHHADRRWLRAGTTIVAHEGIFHLAESAVHLNGVSIRTQKLLREGDTHQVMQTGWVEFASNRGGRALCVARPSAWHRVVHAVPNFLRQWLEGPVTVVAKGSDKPL